MPFPDFPKKHYRAALIFLNLFVIAFWYFSFDGFEFYDDYMYAKYAIAVNAGTFDESMHHFAHRWAIIYPTALIFKIFGFSEYAMILWPLLCTLATLNTVYFLFRKEPQLAIVAAILFALDFYTLYFSKLLFPDSMVTCFSLVALGALYTGRKEVKLNYIAGIIFVLSLMIVFLAKLTAVYLLPFLAFVFIMDMVAGKSIRFWLFALLCGAMVLGSYFVWYDLTYGHAFFRFQSIQANHYVWGKSYFDKPFSFTLSRITYAPFIMLIASGLFIVIILGSPSIIRIVSKFKVRLFDTEHFWAFCALLSLLAFWFFSTSFQYYNPIALNPRHLLLIVPMFAILGAINVKKIFKRKSLCLYYALSFTVVTALSFWFRLGNISLIYILLSIFFWLLYVLRRYNHSLLLGFPLGKVSFYALFLILMIHPVYHILKPPVSGYAELQRLVNKYFDKENDKVGVLVITDSMLAEGIDILYDFEERNVVYLGFNKATKTVMKKYQNVYVLKSDYNLNRILKSNGFQDFNRSLSQWDRSKELIEQSGPISVFRVIEM